MIQAIFKESDRFSKINFLFQEISLRLLILSHLGLYFLGWTKKASDKILENKRHNILNSLLYPIIVSGWGPTKKPFKAFCPQFLQLLKLGLPLFSELSKFPSMCILRLPLKSLIIVFTHLIYIFVLFMCVCVSNWSFPYIGSINVFSDSSVLQKYNFKINLFQICSFQKCQFKVYLTDFIQYPFQIS